MYQASPLKLLLKCGFFAGALVLTACSSPTVQRSSVPAQPAPQVEEKIVTLSADALIRQAREVWQQRADKTQRDALLLDAATAYLQEDDHKRARKLLLMLNKTGLAPSQQATANTLLAQSYSDAPDANPQALIDLLLPLAENPELQARQRCILTELYEKQADYLAAANNYVQIMTPSAASVERVWRWINQTPVEALSDAAQTYPALQPYLSLHQLLARHGLNSQALTAELNQFRQVYRGSALVEFLPEEVTQASRLTSVRITKAAVLLPLSGRFAATGKAIKEGILAGYYARTGQDSSGFAQQLEFIDTNNKTAEQLASAVGDTKWLIGPLLKENIEGLLPLLAPDTHLLALNRVDLLPQASISASAQALIPEDLYISNLLPKYAAWFALAPEDEAYQLADEIFAKGYRSPIVVAADGAIYQRLLDAFQQRWQAQVKQTGRTQGHELDVVRYTDSASLKEGITESLGVAQSKTRIDQIRYMVNEKLHNVTRNRHDIDAIVVFASPEQTELLNPMVEASLSPFDGKTVPVYATSRSMEYDSSNNQWRDLQNVRFIDMPWLLPAHQWQTLENETRQLWPVRSTSQSRFFAFGVDAFQMLPYLTNLSIVPQASLHGLTGMLSMNANGEVKRVLPQAIIDNERVKPLDKGE